MTFETRTHTSRHLPSRLPTHHWYSLQREPLARILGYAEDALPGIHGVHHMAVAPQLELPDMHRSLGYRLSRMLDIHEYAGTTEVRATALVYDSIDPVEAPGEPRGDLQAELPHVIV